MSHLQFRPAERGDTGLILRFIRALAEYEHMSDEVVATEELLHDWLFEKRAAEVLFAVEDGKEVGFALFFGNFSTFLGRGGIYLEDLFVKKEHRGHGYGRALLRALALPEHLSTAALLDVLGTLTTREELVEECENCQYPIEHFLKNFRGN